jgi:hypothetical protein
VALYHCNFGTVIRQDVCCGTGPSPGLHTSDSGLIVVVPDQDRDGMNVIVNNP